MVRASLNDHRRANALLLAPLRRLARVTPGGNHAPIPRRIVVWRMGNLGDIIVALPAFHALRRLFPEAHLTLVTSPTRRGAPGALEVLAADTTFDEMIVYYEDESSKPDFLKNLRRRLRKLQPDTAIILADEPTSLASMLKYAGMLLSAGVRRFAGMWLFDPRRHAQLHQSDRLIRVVQELGAAEVEPFPWLRVHDADRAHATRLLAPLEGKTLVAMQCGAKRPANRWPAERYIELGRRIIDEHDAALVLPGSSGERELLEQIAAGIGGRCLNLAGQTSITELGAVAERCAAFVSNDTGTMHVAYAMGTPVVAVFSARYFPVLWYPYGAQHRVLRAEVPCSPCRADVCPLYDVPECLRLISVDAVAEALRQLLADAARPGGYGTGVNEAS